ncbi:MAG: NAD(P)-binding domain-containing protein [Muribaculaceae bacterium]|nr:NAD(P)-binding domain-containing protein [Muribaculaceae bacterium]
MNQVKKIDGKSLDGKKIAIIGGGAMGGALARGLLEYGKINPSMLTVANPHTEKLDDLKSKGVNITKSNIEACSGAEIIIIAVKPWKVNEVIKEILLQIDEEKTEISLIVAGIPGKDILLMFEDHIPNNISISMPNTAMSAGASMTFITPLNGKPILAETIFENLGKVKIIEERLLPAATALASCGIAYAMRYVRAATEGGVELGFRASEAKEIIVQTIEGATALLNFPDSHPESEIDKVTTPGGLTIKGLNTMEKYGFTTSVIEGLKASVK